MTVAVRGSRSRSAAGRSKAPRARVDLAPLRTLLDRIRDAYRPEQVWLFGSRARGDARPDSDWDLLVLVPDATPDDDLDPLRAWLLQRDSGVSADVIPVRVSDFQDYKEVVNTLSYEVAHHGFRVDDT